VSENEIISGCQSNNPIVRRWKLLQPRPSGSSSSSSSSSIYSSTDLPELEEVGVQVPHNHWVVACTSLGPGINETYPQGVFITGCLDSVIRIYDPNTQELLLQLTEHTKGVISFSWTVTHKLISGSWDGTARIWDLDLGGGCLMELTGHENGVNVLGLESGHVMTTSSGVTIDSKPMNFQLRVWDPVTGLQLGDSVQDHTGPIKAICSLTGRRGFATCSNDGTICAYAIDINAMDLEEDKSPGNLEKLDSSALKLVSRMIHPLLDDTHDSFVLAVARLDSDGSRCEVVSCGEDGVGIHNANTGEKLQAIPHPSAAWCALGLPGKDGDFLTGSDDGIIRWFSRKPQYASNASAIQQTLQLTEQFVENMQAKRLRNGPSAEELAKATKWEDRGTQMSKSEGTVMVFNKGGKMIAAEMSSGNWVELGEVAGKSGDGGQVAGVQYDHVMDVEIDAAGGGTRALKLGYNDGENPFIAARRFIDQNEIGNNFLQQVADWILDRSGRSQVPTLGGAAGQSSLVGQSGASSAPPPLPAASQRFTYSLAAFVATSDMPNIDKLLAKIQEFNGEAGANKVSLGEIHAVESLLVTLKDSSRYHVSTVSDAEAAVVIKMLATWEPEKLFPVFDVARLAALHPSGSALLAKAGPSVFERALELCQRSDTATFTVLTALRLLGNSFRHEVLRTALLESGAVKTDTMLISLIVCCHEHCKSPNKSVRAAVANITCNLTVCMLTVPEFKSMLFNTQDTFLKLMDLLNEQLSHENELLENVFKVLSALGTVIYRGGALMQDKVKRMDGAADVDSSTILSIVASNWAGRSNETVDKCIAEIRALLNI